MSSEHAVRIEGISKLYRIGAQIDPRSFRETLVDLVTLKRRREAPDARDLWALRDVSFDVERGEAVGIIGQNGAGKSTLLKILSRITEPTSGRIELRGRVSSLLEVGTGFHAELTGRENIQLNGAILGMTRREIRERFDDIVAFAEVERFIDTPVKYYSSGMYMRLAFAVAAHLEPEILIVDEVLAVGDAAFQAKCLRKMDDVASHGRTVLFVSHNMAAVNALCRTAVWLKGGQVVARGETASVVAKYLETAATAGVRKEIDEVIASLPEDPAFRLHGVRLLQNGEDVELVANGDALDVEIDFEAKTSTRGLNVTVQLFDHDDILLFDSIHNGDAGADTLVQQGRYVATCRIPADFLAARGYQVRIDAGISEIRHCLREPLRINIDVQQTGVVHSSYPGYRTPARLAPRLAWRVERR
jgi:homopolymeric O-antigen transport system ATP-binding protein